jgi:hypothetical protein
MALVAIPHKSSETPIQFAAGVPIKILEATSAVPTIGKRFMARQLDFRPSVEIAAEDDAGALTRP